MPRKFSKTSRQAYHEAKKELILAHQKKIVKALKKMKAGNYEDIALKAALEKHQVGRRLKELIFMEKIIKMTITKKTESGRNSYIYRLA